MNDYIYNNYTTNSIALINFISILVLLVVIHKMLTIESIV